MICNPGPWPGRREWGGREGRVGVDDKVEGVKSPIMDLHHPLKFLKTEIAAAYK